ncbi:MAG: 3-ketoacyl-ACP reductase [Phycisphaeraceae bacterium]|nr:3-ketoacyl-ACP reductase [Phycisphaeraceae bacterium]
MSERESHRVAIVTGAGRGIGRAIALSLAADGARLLINYHSNAEAAQLTADQVRQAGGEAVIVRADVGVDADRRRMLDQAGEAFGPVDLLVNNAGMAPKVRADLLEMSEQSFDEVLATNLKGPFMFSQLVSLHMIEHRADFGDRVTPAIINIGSISAYAASVNRGEYCVAKAGIGMMTALFAARLAEHGIQVFEIRPGIIETDMTSGVKEKYDKLILEQGLTPIRRWGRPEDIGRAVAAIAGGAFPFSTGETINVDGGFHLRRL